MKKLILLLVISYIASSCVGNKNNTVANATTEIISKDKRPNILYVFTDDQTIRSLSTYQQSHNWVKTPNIDKLAAQGVQFNFCYTGAKCVPSRGSALTGQFQYNYTKKTTYWPTEFRKQGYYTGMVGKWHWSKPRHDETWDWSAVWEHYLPENHNNYYYDQKLRINGDSLVPLNKYSTDGYTDYTIKFLKERATQKDQPWFFWLCYGGVHGPYTPADRHISTYAKEAKVKIPEDVFGPRLDKPEYQRDLTMWKKDENGLPIHNGRSLDSWVKQYNEAVRSIDDGLGRIMATLKETGQIDNTVIIFTSDNGFAWGQHGYRLKIAPYDANQRTPLIVSRPEDRLNKGKQCDYPVNGLDIIKTIHSLSSVNPSNKLDGRDFISLLENPQDKSWIDAPMIHTYTGNLYGNEQITKELKAAYTTDNWKQFIAHKKTGIRAWVMLRKGNFKYVRYIYKDYIEELYDLSKDPEELTNLAVNQNYHPLLADLRKEMVETMKQKGSTFTGLLPEPKIITK